MRIFKHITFADGINLSLADFKRVFATHLKDLSEKEVKQSYEIATKGNFELSDITTKRKKSNKK